MARGLFAYLDGRDADEADAPGLGRARRPPRLAARRARRCRPAVGARGQVRALPRVPRRRAGRDRHRRRSSTTSARAGRRRESPTSRIPVCHFMHGSLGAAAEAAPAARSRPDEIEDVLVAVPAEAASRSCSSRPSRRRLPRSEYEGKFSLQYSVASMLVRGHVAVARLHRRGDRRPGRARRGGEGALRDEASTRRIRRRSPGGVRVPLADGTTLEADFPYQKGGPENPLSADEVREKFRGNASLALADGRGRGARGGDPGARGRRTTYRSAGPAQRRQRSAVAA